MEFAYSTPTFFAVGDLVLINMRLYLMFWTILSILNLFLKNELDRQGEDGGGTICKLHGCYVALCYKCSFSIFIFISLK